MTEDETFEVNRITQENRYTHAPLHRLDNSKRLFSTRKKPVPTFSGIRSICSHYQTKAKGEYGSKLAVRYLHNLIDDLMQYIEPLSVEFDRMYCKCKSSENILREWNTSFENDHIHTPSQAKAEIDRLRADNARLSMRVNDLEAQKTMPIPLESTYAAPVSDSTEELLQQIARLKRTMTPLDTLSSMVKESKRERIVLM
ncbi:hypothetical protein PCE1_004309 [Barthelona sp. PCE]